MGGAKPARPKGYGTLRAISIIIGVVVFVVIASVLYSAYADYRSLTAGKQGIVVGRELAGEAATITVNASVANGGLYAIDATLSCDPPVPSGVDCAPSSIVVQPGSAGVLRFSFTIANYTQWAASPSHSIRGTIRGDLVPFASISVGVDLGSLAQQGGP